MRAVMNKITILPITITARGVRNDFFGSLRTCVLTRANLSLNLNVANGANFVLI